MSIRLADAPRWLRSCLAPLMAFALVVAVGSEWAQGPSWDEAVYLSQVSPGIPAVRFVASRARGIQFVVTPAAAITSNMPVIRVWMLLAALLAIALAFRAWRPVVPTRTLWIAQVLFLGCWLVPFYATKVMPNLWTALAGLVAVALLYRSVRAGEPVTVPLAVALAAMAFLRPTDAAVLGAVLGVWLLIRRPPAFARNLVALIGGVLVGALPWAIEVSVRFGGVRGAISSALSASHIGAGGMSQRLRQYLSVMDGPTLGPVHWPDVPLIGTALLVAAIGLIAVGVAQANDHRSAVRLACAGGAALSAFYILVVGGIAPRFLLPGIALLAIPAGEGAAALWTRKPAALRALLAAGLGVAVVWNIVVFREQELTVTRSAAINDRITDLAVEGGLPDGCIIFSRYSFPQLDYLTGCAGHPLGSSIDAALMADRCVVVVTSRGEPAPGGGLLTLGHVAGRSVLSSAACGDR